MSRSAWLSPDGFTWSAQALDEAFYDVAVTENGTRMAVTQTFPYISTDGATWSRLDSYYVGKSWGITWDRTRSLFWAVGSEYIYTGSSDGKRWDIVYRNGGTLLRDILCVGSRCVTVGSAGTAVIISTDDGQNFAQQSVPGVAALQSIAYGAGLWVIVGSGSDPVILTSPTGLPKSWTQQATPPVTAKVELRGIAWNGKLFVTVGSYAIFTSPDGITWTDQKSGVNPESSWSGIGWGGGLWVAISSNISTSYDGVHWSLGNRPESAIMDHLVYYG